MKKRSVHLSSLVTLFVLGSTSGYCAIFVRGQVAQSLVKHESLEEVATILNGAYIQVPVLEVHPGQEAVGLANVLDKLNNTVISKIKSAYFKSGIGWADDPTISAGIIRMCRSLKLQNSSGVELTAAERAVIDLIYRKSAPSRLTPSLKDLVEKADDLKVIYELAEKNAPALARRIQDLHKPHYEALLQNGPEYAKLLWKAYQDKNAKVEDSSPANISPSGEVILSDGHHGLREKYELMQLIQHHGGIAEYPDEKFLTNIRVHTNFSNPANMPQWGSHLSEICKKRQIYFSPENRHRIINALHDTNEYGPVLEAMQEVYEVAISPTIATISHNPTRSFLGAVLTSIQDNRAHRANLENAPLVDYVEFYIGEWFQKKLGFSPFAEDNIVVSRPNSADELGLRKYLRFLKYAAKFRKMIYGEEGTSSDEFEALLVRLIHPDRRVSKQMTKREVEEILARSLGSPHESPNSSSNNVFGDQVDENTHRLVEVLSMFETQRAAYRKLVEERRTHVSGSERAAAACSATSSIASGALAYFKAFSSSLENAMGAVEPEFEAATVAAGGASNGLSNGSSLSSLEIEMLRPGTCLNPLGLDPRAALQEALEDRSAGGSMLAGTSSSGLISERLYGPQRIPLAQVKAEIALLEAGWSEQLEEQIDLDLITQTF